MDLDRILGRLGWRPEWRATKFVTYFQLADACGRPGCPVCRCLREQSFRALDALLYEQVTDPATRQVLDESWGFCAWHAAMAIEVRNASLGIAIIYQDLLGRLRGRLGGTHRELARRWGPAWRRLFRRPAPARLVQARAGRRVCLLCADLAASEESLLQTLLDYVDDPEFEAVYLPSVGICLPHLTLALARFPDHARAASLVGHTIRKLDRLKRQLRGFIEKHDHRTRARFTDEEVASWTDALEFMAGRSELFGHEMPRRVGRTERPSEAAPPPATRGDDPETAEQLRERLEALAIEKGRLERRLADLTRQFGDQSSRAAALHYRLWSTNEDRRVLELNLAGERSAAHTWQSIADELRAEVDHLKARLAKYEPRPEDAA